MIYWSAQSRRILAELHPDLQRLLAAVAERLPPSLDLALTCGHRGQAAQDAAYDRGASKLRWPHSAHNKTPAEAFDFCAPLPDRYDPTLLAMRQGAIRQLAYELGVPLRPLIAWDLPHVELAK